MTDVTDTGGSRGRGQPEIGPETPASPARLLPARESAGKPAAHLAAIADLQAAYAAIPPGSPVRLAKRTSNLFRFTDGKGKGAHRGAGYGSGHGRAGHGSGAASRGLDVSAFGRVLSVDPRSRIAVTGGMTTYEDLADATLRHDLMPLVVPQLKTITIGGAVTGLGIESSSLRSGMPHESVLEMEILTGDGRVITAAPGGEHDALYRGFPNSYGTLGYALSLTIELEPVRPFVHLRHFRFGSPEACMDAVAAIAADGGYLGHRADFVDGTAFGLDELYLTVGSFSDVAHSACSARSSGGCGRAGTAAPTCTGSWSPWTGGTDCPRRLTPAAASRSMRTSSRTWRSRSSAARSSCGPSPPGSG